MAKASPRLSIQPSNLGNCCFRTKASRSSESAFSFTAGVPAVGVMNPSQVEEEDVCRSARGQTRHREGEQQYTLEKQ